MAGGCDWTLYDRYRVVGGAVPEPLVGDSQSGSMRTARTEPLGMVAPARGASCGREQRRSTSGVTASEAGRMIVHEAINPMLSCREELG